MEINKGQTGCRSCQWLRNKRYALTRQMTRLEEQRTDAERATAVIRVTTNYAPVYSGGSDHSFMILDLSSVFIQFHFLINYSISFYSISLFIQYSANIGKLFCQVLQLRQAVNYLKENRSHRFRYTQRKISGDAHAKCS